MSSALRNFIVTFILFLIIFGIGGHVLATNVIPSIISSEANADSSDDNTDNNENVNLPEENLSDENNSTNDDFDSSKICDTYTIAFFGLGVNEELVEIYLIHINKDYKTSTSVSIPGSSTAEVGGFSFEDLYRKNGAEFLVNKLLYLTGYTIDDYACLKAVDRNGRGHSITDLSKRYTFNYRVNEAFEYPDPSYESYREQMENNEVLSDEESDEVSSEESTEPIIRNEYFSVEPGNYALHGITNGINNYAILLDSEYNPNAYAIYEDFFKRIVNNLSSKDSIDDQAALFRCFDNKTFSVDNYAGTDVANYLFKYNNQQISCDCEKISDWDNLRTILKAKEKGVTE
ncbi:MAG: hypothetical protein E7597_03870 [Ruminococcaceae bacterium]|nr:hypothetical protein [Oscillospiraceae bacterium]